MQETCQVHHEALGTTTERAIRYSCLDAELLGADAEKCDWANTEFIGYSWFKDDQFAATKDLPFFDAMITRPPQINFTGNRPSMPLVVDKTQTPPHLPFGCRICRSMQDNGWELPRPRSDQWRKARTAG